MAARVALSNAQFAKNTSLFVFVFHFQKEALNVFAWRCREKGLCPAKRAKLPDNVAQHATLAMAAGPLTKIVLHMKLFFLDFLCFFLKSSFQRMEVLQVATGYLTFAISTGPLCLLQAKYVYAGSGMSIFLSRLRLRLCCEASSGRCDIPCFAVMAL